MNASDLAVAGVAARARKGGGGATGGDQLGLALPPEKKGWGGKRDGAGRPRGLRPKVAHRERPALSRHHPSHVTLRALPHVWNLRSQRAFSIIRAALTAVRPRESSRVVHYSVQGNHLHLILEAADARALGLGVKALGIRLAKGLNRMMGTRGPVFLDRYHAHALRTPREVRHALAYVLLNHRSHMARLGKPAACAEIDPYSSAAVFDGWANPVATPADPAALGVAPARTWLMTTGWRRRGPIPLQETPAPLR